VKKRRRTRRERKNRGGLGATEDKGKTEIKT
jgi:hypothetical protein